MPPRSNTAPADDDLVMRIADEVERRLLQPEPMVEATGQIDEQDLLRSKEAAFVAGK
jgi:hypothetical protein